METRLGELAAAWLGGTRERNPDVCIYVARNENGKWQEAVRAADGVPADGSRLPTWNPALFQPKGGPLKLFYKVGPSPSKWWGPLSLDALRANTAKHAIPLAQLTELPYPRTYAWVIEDVRPLPRPPAYRHPYGAVIWVTLTPANVEDFARLRDGAKS